jgi:hypothetical protein
MPRWGLPAPARAGKECGGGGGGGSCSGKGSALTSARCDVSVAAEAACTGPQDARQATGPDPNPAPGINLATQLLPGSPRFPGGLHVRPRWPRRGCRSAGEQRHVACARAWRRAPPRRDRRRGAGA